MASFLDFAELKAKVSFSDAIDLLNLRLKLAGNQFRGACPVCKNAGDRALVVTPDRGFFCFGVKAGGDVIALAAHVLELGAKDAAQELAQRAGIVPVQSTSRTVPSYSSRERNPPESERGNETQKLAPLTYLEHDHDAVVAVGFDPDFCKTHGVGYAGRGVAKGHVLIPFRDEQGILLGYVGVTDAWLPSDFKPKVVEFKKRA